MKKTLILAGIAATLGAFVFFYEIRGGEAREEAEEYEASLIKMERDDVQSVTLVQAEGEIIRYERAGDNWEITEPVRTAAEESAINGNFSAFANANIKRRLVTTQEKLKNFGLEPAHAEVLIEATDGRKVELLVGDESPTRGDLFVTFRDSNTVFVTSNNVKTQAEKTLLNLRDKKIAHYEKDDVNRLELMTKDHTIAIEKSGEEWKMTFPDLPVEESRVNSYLNTLTNYSAKEFAAEEFDDPSKYGFDSPQAKLTLSLGEERATKELVIGKIAEGAEDPDYYAYESGRSPVFIIRESTKNNVTRDPFYFQDKKLARFDEEALREIRISGAFQITLAPQDTLSWYVHGDSSFGVEDSDMNRLYSHIRGVSAAELVTEKPDDLANFGLKNPFLEVVLTDTNAVAVGFEIGDSDEDDDRYASVKNRTHVYKVRLSPIERIADWIEEILGAEQEDESISSS